MFSKKLNTPSPPAWKRILPGNSQKQFNLSETWSSSEQLSGQKSTPYFFSSQIRLQGQCYLGYIKDEEQQNFNLALIKIVELFAIISLLEEKYFADKIITIPVTLLSKEKNIMFSKLIDTEATSYAFINKKQIKLFCQHLDLDSSFIAEPKKLYG